MKIREKNITKTISATLATVKTFNRDSREIEKNIFTLDGNVPDEMILKTLKKQGVFAYELITSERIDSLRKMTESNFKAYAVEVEKQAVGKINRTIDTIVMSFDVFNITSESPESIQLSFTGILNKIDDDFVNEYVDEYFNGKYMVLGVESTIVHSALYAMDVADFVRFSEKA